MLGRRPLTALTRDVLVSTTSGTTTMHAPANNCGTVEPLCAPVACNGLRLVAANAVETHYTPCEDCFDLETD